MHTCPLLRRAGLCFCREVVSLRTLVRRSGSPASAQTRCTVRACQDNPGDHLLGRQCVWAVWGARTLQKSQALGLGKCLGQTPFLFLKRWSSTSGHTTLPPHLLPSQKLEVCGLVGYSPQPCSQHTGKKECVVCPSPSKCRASGKYIQSCSRNHLPGDQG